MQSSVRCLSVSSAGSVYAKVLQPLPLWQLAVNPIGYLHAPLKRLGGFLHLLSQLLHWTERTGKKGKTRTEDVQLNIVQTYYYVLNT